MPQVNIPPHLQHSGSFGGRWTPNMANPGGGGGTPFGGAAFPGMFRASVGDSNPFGGGGGPVFGHYAGDADHFGFLQSQVAHLETEQWRILYADIQYPTLVPVDRSAWEWAPSILRYTMDGHGVAQPLGVRAEDMPLVAVSREQLIQKVESLLGRLRLHDRGTGSCAARSEREPAGRQGKHRQPRDGGVAGRRYSERSRRSGVGQLAERFGHHQRQCPEQRGRQLQGVG